MTMITPLPSRAVLAVTGEDRVGYLQGLVSNDVAAAAPGRAVWAALLTPQGKWLADFFIFSAGDTLLLDVEAAQADDLVRRLTRFRLRAKVAVAADSRAVHAAWGGPPPPAPIAAPDPRLPEAGWRILAHDPVPASATPADYDHHRLGLGLPDGSRDMEAEKSTLLEAGFDELGGVSWTKGCYMGQELTARTKYRGLVKRRLIPVSADGPLPAPGTPVTQDGVEVGVLRSAAGRCGLALLRTESWNNLLSCDGVRIEASPPAWWSGPGSG